eukprot:SAG31_NODE_1467_length_8227_cov_7.040108_2_plen_69_part_00
MSQLPPWEPNCAHTDGEAYGDRYPPYLFLLFGHQSAEGGENGLVDSYGFVHSKCCGSVGLRIKHMPAG